MKPLPPPVTQAEKIWRRIFTLVCVLFCYVVIAGCYHPRGVWAYRPSPYPIPREGTINQTIVVLPFKDSRPIQNTSKFFGMPMLLVPLIPYGWADYSRPESPEAVKLEDVARDYDALFRPWAITQWQFRPEKDFAEATVEEFNASRLFKEAVFSEQASDGDFILRGELKATRYKAKAHTYGLGFFAWFPMMLGAPVGNVTNELMVEFVLEERVTGRPLWHKGYHKTKDATFFLYWSPPEFYYDVLFKTILEDVVKDLEATLASKKAAFPPNRTPAAISLLPHSQSAARDEAGVPLADRFLGHRQRFLTASWGTS